MATETDYSSMIKDFLSQNNINLGEKSLEQFLGEISNLQNLQSGGHIQIGDFQIVKAPTGEISIVDSKNQTADSTLSSSTDLTASQLSGQDRSQEIEQPAAEQVPEPSQSNGQEEEEPKEERRKKKKKHKKKKKKKHRDDDSDSEGGSESDKSESSRSRSRSHKKKEKEKEETCESIAFTESRQT
jgi:hypothetical protein